MVNSKYFGSHFPKFEEQDRLCTARKNWKERSKLLNDLFVLACQHPGEFAANSHIKKYMGIALEHLDEKNPGMLLNGVSTLSKVAEHFPQALEECLYPLLERIAAVI